MRDEDVKRLDSKLDKMDERLDRIDTTLAAQHVSLKEHMKRSDLLEAHLEPVKKHVAMVEGALKFVGMIGVVFGIIQGVIKLVEFLK